MTVQRDWEAMSFRERQIEDMIKRSTDAIPRTARVRVLPRDDEIRKALVHPGGMLGFPASGSVEWPLDNFTQRRLIDGTVYIDGPAPPEAAHNLTQREVAHQNYLTELAKRYRARVGDRDAVYDIDTAQHPGELAHKVDAAHPVGTVVREQDVKAGTYPLSSTGRHDGQPHVRGYGAPAGARQARVTTTDVRRQTPEAREMIAARREEEARHAADIQRRDAELRREPMTHTPPASPPPPPRAAQPRPRPASADVPNEAPTSPSE